MSKLQDRGVTWVEYKAGISDEDGERKEYIWSEWADWIDWTNDELIDRSMVNNLHSYRSDLD